MKPRYDEQLRHEVLRGAAMVDNVHLSVEVAVAAGIHEKVGRGANESETRGVEANRFRTSVDPFRIVKEDVVGEEPSFRVAQHAQKKRGLAHALETAENDVAVFKCYGAAVQKEHVATRCKIGGQRPDANKLVTGLVRVSANLAVEEGMVVDQVEGHDRGLRSLAGAQSSISDKTFNIDSSVAHEHPPADLLHGILKCLAVIWISFRAPKVVRVNHVDAQVGRGNRWNLVSREDQGDCVKILTTVTAQKQVNVMNSEMKFFGHCHLIVLSCWSEAPKVK